MAPARKVLACLVAVFLSWSAISLTMADDDDHDRARRALEAGEIMPLRSIIERVERDYPGQIIEVELERDDGLWVYEIELLRSSGALTKLKLNAGDGTLLGIKGREIERATVRSQALMRILLAEDDPLLATQLAKELAGAGYAVDTADNGVDAHHLGDVEAFDAVVLDLGLPQMDGLTVLKRWRAAGRNMPVLILTARDTWHEKVDGIDAGADDYLTKPFHMEELLARIRALIRRSSGLASTEIICGPVTLDTRSGRITVNGRGVSLTGHELRVLTYLMHHKDELVTRTELIDHIYTQEFDRDSNTIEVFIARLRKKLPADLIHTSRGLGYRLVCPD